MVDEVDGDHGRARRPVRGRAGRSTSRAGPCGPSGPPATPPATSASTATTAGCCSRATTSSPGSRPTSRSTPSSSPTRWATTWSLAKVRGPRADEVLPAHEYRFADLDGRLDEIIAHHADRLEEIEQVHRPTTRARTAWEITLRLHWSRPWDEIESFMQRQANGETLAHCVLLELHGTGAAEGTHPPASSWPSMPRSEVRRTDGNSASPPPASAPARRRRATVVVVLVVIVRRRGVMSAAAPSSSTPTRPPRRRVRPPPRPPPACRIGRAGRSPVARPTVPRGRRRAVAAPSPLSRGRRWWPTARGLTVLGGLAPSQASVATVYAVDAGGGLVDPGRHPGRRRPRRRRGHHRHGPPSCSAAARRTRWRPCSRCPPRPSRPPATAPRRPPPAAVGRTAARDHGPTWPRPPSGSTAYVVGGYDGTTYQPQVLATTDGTHFTTVANLAVPGPLPGGGRRGRPALRVRRPDARRPARRPRPPTTSRSSTRPPTPPRSSAHLPQAALRRRRLRARRHALRGRRPGPGRADPDHRSTPSCPSTGKVLERRAAPPGRGVRRLHDRRIGHGRRRLHRRRRGGRPVRSRPGRRRLGHAPDGAVAAARAPGAVPAGTPGAGRALRRAPCSSPTGATTGWSPSTPAAT